jgi:hypothetical protein
VLFAYASSAAAAMPASVPGGSTRFALDDCTDLTVELVDEHAGVPKGVPVPVARGAGLAVPTEAVEGVRPDLDLRAVLGVVESLVLRELARH